MIESAQNKIAKEIRALRQKKVRDKMNLFIAEGIRFVAELPENWPIEYYAVSHSAKEEVDKYLKDNVPVYIFADQIFDTLGETQNPQGVLAVCRKAEQNPNAVFKAGGDKAFYILLEELQDPGNIGTIIRTADACGASGVFMSHGCVDLYNSKVLRSTMGSLFHIPIMQGVDLKEMIQELQGRNVRVFAAHLKGHRFPSEINLKTSCGILIGNEANGLSDEMSACAETLVKIPMPGKAESLNAAIAAGILMYEVVRQRINL